MITEPGIYDISMQEYLKDPCPEPSLSAGGVTVLLDQSPQHAYMGHPRLGAAKGGDSSRADLGSAIHSASLGGADIEYCPVVNGPKAKNPGEAVTAWQSADAKAWRDKVRASGRIPLLQHQRRDIENAATHIQKAFDEQGLGVFESRCEITVVACIDGVWIRTRPDLANFDRKVIVNLKSADTANPSRWIKRVLFSSDYYTGGELYVRAMEAATGTTGWKHLWLAAEYEAPYAYSWVALDPMASAIGGGRVDRAIGLWRECLETGEWPGYSKDIHYAEAPGWLAWENEMETEAL